MTDGMNKPIEALLSGELLEEDASLSLNELCRICQIKPEAVMTLIDYGVVEAIGDDSVGWHFHTLSVRRVRSAQRLEHDLGINTAGVALALDLLDELETMRARLRQFSDL